MEEVAPGKRQGGYPACEGKKSFFSDCVLCVDF